MIGNRLQLQVKLGAIMRAETGISLLETVVALGVLGTVAVVFLTGLIITTRAAATTDEQGTAESVARSQMEWAQSANYTANATGYSAAVLPNGKDFGNYSANISAHPLHNPDDGIQKITVTVWHSGQDVFTLEGYKTNR